MMANDWGDLGFVPDNDDFADLGFQPDSLARAAAEFDIDEPQKLAPLSTFWNALTQSAAEKPALMLRGATAYTPGEAAGFDKTLERVAARLSTLKDPEKRKRAELALQGHLWPARSDDPWYKVDPDLVPNVVNTLAAQLGDQIPITTATVLGRMVGKAVGSIAGIGTGVGVAMATAGPDPSDIAVSPVVAAVTRKLVEHIGGATPMVLLETGSFLQSAEWLGIDKDIAEKYATLYGPAAGAIEYVQQLWNLKALKGVAEPIKKKLLGRVLFAIGGNVFEGVEEMSQGGLERYLIGKAIEEMKARDPDFEAKKPKPFSLEESGREFAIGTIMGTMFSTGGKAVKMLQEETSRKDVTADQIQQAVDKAVTAIKDDPDLSDGQKAELLTAVERVYMKGFTAKLTAIRNNADNMVVGAGDKARQKKAMLSDLDQIVQHYKTIADEIEANKAAMPELDEIKQLLPDYEAAVKNFVKNPSEEGFGQIKALGDRIAELGAEYGENISTERAKEIGKIKTIDDFKAAISKLNIKGITKEHIEATAALIEGHAKAVGKTADAWISENIAGVTSEAQDVRGTETLQQLTKTVYDYAKKAGYITEEAQKVWDALQVWTEIDRYMNAGRSTDEDAGPIRRLKEGRRFYNITGINEALRADPEAVAKIRAAEEATGFKVLGDNDQLLRSHTHPIEQRTEIKSPGSKIGQNEYQTFQTFIRSFAQTFVDKFDPEAIEHFRSQIVKAVEAAYKDAQAGSQQAQKLFGKTAQRVKAREFTVSPPLRDADKTLAAINLSTICPMFHIGASGCYLDGCYVTGMGRTTSAVNFYRSALYTGEILQLSQDTINKLNAIGGLRVNGMGDLSMDQINQVRDIFRHAAMRGLKLKVITKQEATLQIVAELQKSDDPLVRKTAKDIVVQTTVDPYWVPVDLDDIPGSMVNLERLMGTTDEQLAEKLKAAGRDAKFINGRLYRKYGFSSQQMQEFAKKYPTVKIQPRAVVGTKKEIAEYALHNPEILQTWMHATIPPGLYSEVEGRVLTEGEVGNYKSRIGVVKIGGEWMILAQGKKGTSDLKQRQLYTDTERYIKENYTPEQADKIFNVLAGQLGKTPSALCCSASAAADACVTCTSHCADRTAYQGRKLYDVAKKGQKYSLYQDASGAVTFLENGQALLQLFENADASTLPHELFHIWTAELQRMVSDPGAPGWVAEALETLEDWLGIENGVWTREHHEHAARGFERWLREGKTTNNKLAEVFRKFREWLRAIYKKLSGSEIDVHVSPEAKAVFDRLVGGTGQVSKVKPTHVVSPAFGGQKAELSTAAEQQQQQQQVEPGPKMDEESRQRDEELGRLFRLAMEGDEAATQKLRDLASEMVGEEPTAEQLFGAEYAEEQRAKEKDADLFGIEPTEETAKKRPEEIASSLNLLKKKVHVLARNLGISDEERRAIQQRLTGKKSMAGMTPEEAKVVAEHFTKLSKEQGLSSSTGEELAESIKKNAPRKKVIERLKGLPAKILSIKRGFDLGQTRPERLLEALDGHKEGPVYRTIWMPVKRGEANARAGVNRRVTDFVDFVEKVFAKQGKVDKHAIKQFVGNAKKTFTDGKATIALTPAERIGVYLYANQEKGLHHLRYGNFKEFANPDPIIADVIRSLTPEEKAVADWMVQELGNNFDRVQDVAQKALGQKLKQESAYFGMFLQGESLEDRQDFLSLLGLLSGPHATQYVPKPGFTKERVGGATQPLNLDAFGNYISLVQRTEQFINMAMVAKRVGDIFKTQSFRQAVNNATDGHGMKNLDKWLSDCIRGHVKESNDWIDKALLILRKNAAVYLLAYNMPSAARQSAAMLTASASHPVIAAKIFQYTAICASHPAAFSEIKAEAAGKSNFMANRNFDRDVAKMRREEKAKNLLLRKKSWDQRLLALQTAVDDFSATLGWKAMYDAAMSNESVQQTFGLDGSEAAAIEFADKWVARTQTVGDVEHLPDFFRGSTMSRLFSTFMNDVNNNLNFWKHDIIGARKAGKISNSMVAYRVFTSWVLPAFMMGVLRRARLPRTWEEVVFDQAAYGLGTYFFVGDIILNSITGFSGARTGIEELALIEAGKALRSAAKEGDIAKAAWHGTKAAGAFTGKIPAQLFRTSEGIYDLATGRTDDLRRLIWSEWSLEKTALGEDGDEGAGGRAVSTRARSSQSSRSGGRRTSSRR